MAELAGLLAVEREPGCKLVVSVLGLPEPKAGKRSDEPSLGCARPPLRMAVSAQGTPGTGLGNMQWDRNRVV
jgi:hypothetical protein